MALTSHDTQSSATQSSSTKSSDTQSSGPHFERRGHFYCKNLTQFQDFYTTSLFWIGGGG